METIITANEYLDVLLKDDKTETGGMSFMGETLKDFLDELEMDYNTPINEVNKALVDCGIEPIMIEKQKRKKGLKEYLQVCESLCQKIKCADNNIIKDYFQKCGTLQTTICHLWHSLYFSSFQYIDEEDIDCLTINNTTIDSKWFESLSPKDKTILRDAFAWQRLPLPSFV